VQKVLVANDFKNATTMRPTRRKFHESLPETFD